MNIRHQDIEDKFHQLLERYTHQTIEEMPQERYDKFKERFYDDFDDALIMLVDDTVKELVEKENYNRGTLKVGWIIKYQGEPWTVDLVNQSRAKISCMRNFTETDISAKAEVPIIQGDINDEREEEETI